MFVSLAAISLFIDDKGEGESRYPQNPSHGMKLALAIKLGSCKLGNMPPIGDIAVSTTRALSMMTKSQGVMTEGMLFAARYVPLPENLGELIWTIVRMRVSSLCAFLLNRHSRCG
jgi:hypothetical protein